MMEGTKSFYKYVLPAILYAVVIFIVSSIPSLTPPRLGTSWDDKIYHFIEYAGFGFLIFRAFLSWKQTSPVGRRTLLTLLIGISIGAVDELHQHFIRNRVPEFSDWYADSAGIVAGTIAALLLVWFVRSRLRGR
ncbi:MAG: VanZ family protein [candidate division Zixibacteria bacterium]|nr:VanZ family protein [candidate division Zixibacteria bacterium]MBU1471058.1 VanZ family protein [candidate division Zixibacteria bacterium]MBU2626734.1 VanZ family protein [candidate division Zixibacteria bacterium]